jgi:predicted ATPase
LLSELPDDRVRDLAQASIADGPTKSLASMVESLLLPIIPLASTLGSMTLYQLHPSPLRAPDVPRPDRRLHRDGSNLPSVVAWIKAHEPRMFRRVLNTVSTVMPTLDDIDVVNAPLNSLQLAFQESEFEHPWRAEEVSDGTLRILGLMVALVDPDTRVVVIEEPENSLHPWAIGQFMDACRELSRTKQIVLTTHSPALIDESKPEDIWIVSRRDGATHVQRLDDLDPDARRGWQDGDYRLSQYLGTGIVREAVPVTPL